MTSGWRFRALLLIVPAAMLGYLGFSLWGGWREVTAALVRIGFAGTAAALALALVNYLLRFVRWQHFLALLGHHLPAATSLRIYLGGFGLTLLPGKVGETVRSVFLRRYGVSYAESLAAFFSDQFSNLLGMLLLTAAGLWAYPPARPWAAALAALLGTVLLALQWTGWLHALDAFARNRLPVRLGGLLSHGIGIALHSGRCLRLPMLAYGIALGLAAWGAEALAFYYVMHLLGSDLSPGSAVFIYAFSMLVGAFSFMPGGLGGMEAAMVALLMLNHIAQPQAVAATVLIRLTTLWFAVALGVVALAFSGRDAPEGT